MEANTWVDVANTSWIGCAVATTPNFNLTFFSGMNKTSNEYVVEVSNDGGVNWSEIDYFTGDGWHGPKGISSSGQYVYVVAENFEIIRSEDFGTTWQTVYPLNNTYLSYDLICDPSGQYVLACGPQRTGNQKKSLMAASSNYGSTWSTQVSPFECLSLAADESWTTIWAATEDSLLYKSTDQGASWTLAANLTFHMAKLTSSSSGQYLTAIGGNSYYSLDYGASWALVSDHSLLGQSNATCQSATVDASGRYVAAVVGIVGTPNITVYLSDTYGQTWFQSTLPTSDALHYRFYCGLRSNTNGSQLVVAEENSRFWQGSITLQSEDMTATYPPSAQPTLWPTQAPSFRPTSTPTAHHDDNDDDGEANNVIIAVSVVAVFLFIVGAGGVVWYCWKQKTQTGSLNRRLMSESNSVM